MGAHLSLKAQNCWLMTCQTISSDAMVGVVREERWWGWRWGLVGWLVKDLVSDPGRCARLLVKVKN